MIRHHLDFLREVDARGALFYDADFVANSVRRYELFWVPLALATVEVDSSSCSGEEDIMPPLDVHWVWHVHMLAPRAYARDIKAATASTSTSSRLFNYK